MSKLRNRQMLACLTLLLPAVSLAQLGNPTTKELVGPRSLALSPDGERLAFTYRGDVWVAPAEGGRAIPITNNIEMEDNPVWSPDGNWIAFSSNRYGNWDIYAVPAQGGESVRLTWHTGSDIPSSFSPDGKYILFNGGRGDQFGGVYMLDVKTTQLKEAFLDMMGVGNPKLSPDGTQVLYNRFGFPWTRPRYEGSAAAQLWRYDMATGKRSVIRDTKQQHLWPHWSPDGRVVYTVTVTEKTPNSHYIDKPMPLNTDNVNRTPNIYRFDMSGRGSRLTDYVGGPVRFLTVAAKSGDIAFEREGAVFRMEPNGKPEKVALTAFIDEKTASEERLILTDGAQQASLSANGEKVAFQVRGEIWMVPVKKGKGPNKDDATQLTDYPGLDQQPFWLPDNKTLLFSSDRDGAERLYSIDTDTKKITPFTTADHDHTGLMFLPDKKSISYWMAGPNGGLFVIPITGGEPKRIIDEPLGTQYAWSPDGRYIAYGKPLVGGGFNYWETQTNIWIKDTQTGEAHNVTQLNTNHSSPEWSADGKYLYFRSDREGGGIYVLPLTQETARETELELKFEKPAAPVKVVVEFEDAYNRIRRLSEQPATHNIVSDPTNGDILFLAGGDIWKVDYAGEEPRKITNGGGIGWFELSADQKMLFYIQNGKPHTLNLRANNFPATAIDFRADWLRNVRLEREAAFRQFWRTYNRSFYDPYFHGRNWTAIRDRYFSLLDGVGHRNEMATVLNMMIGELEASHTEAGAAPGNPSSQSSAHPGFSIDYSYAGPGLKVKDVPHRAPGSYEKTRIRPGEYVMAINGVDVRADEALWRDVLNEQTNREITLLVNSSPTKTGAREVKYRALSGGAWSNIHYQNLIDWRRKYVEQKSGGKLTYLHIAGMGGGNYNTFNREAWQYAQGKQGVIIDVRNNGGGNIADMLIDILEREPQMLYKPRDGDVYTAPGTAWNRPTVVMMAETSFSNAEMFPAAMKTRGLATTVGMPTPGYVIYTGGFRLVDGTSARMPGTGVYRMDGSPLENMGEVPDFMVQITPEQVFSKQDPQLDKAIEILMSKVR